MNASKNALGSDLARVDAHTIQPHEYDELPEITDADLARGTWMINGQPTTETCTARAYPNWRRVPETDGH